MNEYKIEKLKSTFLNKKNKNNRAARNYVFIFNYFLYFHLMQLKGLYLLLVQLFFFLCLSAQESDRLDSLLLEAKKKNIDSVQVDVLNAIASEYRNSDMDQVKVFADSALKISTKIDYYQGQVKSHFNIGNMYYIKGEFSLTLKSYLKALSIL